MSDLKRDQNSLQVENSSEAISLHSEPSAKLCDFPFQGDCTQKEACLTANRCLKNLSEPSAPKVEPWPDERLHEYIWTQINEQGGTGNLLKPDGVSDSRFDRLVNEIAKSRRDAPTEKK